MMKNKIEYDYIRSTTFVCVSASARVRACIYVFVYVCFCETAHLSVRVCVCVCEYPCLCIFVCVMCVSVFMWECVHQTRTVRDHSQLTQLTTFRIFTPPLPRD